jgi:hypothetical protein
MSFRKIITGFCCLFFTLLCFSQTDSLNRKTIVSSNISLALNGSLIYPGIRAGIEFPVTTIDLTISRKSKDPKFVMKDRFAAGNIGWYHHPDFHDNLYLTAEWRMRRTLRGGFFSEFSPGLGYSRTFLGGTTYEVNDNGDVKIERLAGYNYALITVGGGAGYNFSEKKGIPVSIYSRLNMLLMFPYNSTVYPRPAIELGVIYLPEGFLPVKVKKRILKK